jgi:hypothetical protein
MNSRRFKQITCIMPTGRALPALNALRQEKKVIDVAHHHARGVGTRRGRGRYVECEVVTVLVDEASADDVFSFLYRAAGLDQPHQGMMFMSGPQRATMMQPPAGFIEY